MKKMTILFIVASVFVLGCGPKGVSRETLSALSEAKAAVDAAESKIKETEKERIELEAQKAEKEKTVRRLEQELEAVKKGSVEGGE